MARPPARDHTQFDFGMEMYEKRPFCRLCAKRRKAKVCPKDSINYEEILSSLGRGQRNAMLTFGQTCEEVVRMSSKDQREWASLDEEDLQRMRREWEERWPV